MGKSSMRLWYADMGKIDASAPPGEQEYGGFTKMVLAPTEADAKQRAMAWLMENEPVTVFLLSIYEEKEVIK